MSNTDITVNSKNKTFTNIERINYYTGYINKLWNIKYDKNTEFSYYDDYNYYIRSCNEQYGTFFINKNFTEEEYIKLFTEKIEKLDDNHPAKEHFKMIIKYDLNSYIIPIIKLFNSDNYFKEKGFIFCPGDIYFDANIPIISKTRPVDTYNNFIINLDNSRHWSEPISIVKKHDIPFEMKNNKIMWRGAPNGLIVQELYNRPNRYTLCKKYSTHENPNIDIGFVYDYLELKGRGYLSIEDMLKSKFLISVEGGDVSTNLKWILYSNSVAIMPKPTMVSWAMEDMLEPWVHYVPLEKDFNDLEEKYNWCLNNIDKCKEIASNGKKYIEQFLDEDREKLITNMVLKEYVDRVNIIKLNE